MNFREILREYRGIRRKISLLHVVDLEEIFLKCDDLWLSALASGARGRGLIHTHSEKKFPYPNMFSLVYFAGMTLNQCGALQIGTSTGGWRTPVQVS